MNAFEQACVVEERGMSSLLPYFGGARWPGKSKLYPTLRALGKVVSCQSMKLIGGKTPFGSP